MNLKKIILSFFMLASYTLSNANGTKTSNSFGRKVIQAVQYSGIIACIGLTSEIFYCNHVTKYNQTDAQNLLVARTTARAYNAGKFIGGKTDQAAKLFTQNPQQNRLQRFIKQARNNKPSKE